MANNRPRTQPEGDVAESKLHTPFAALAKLREGLPAGNPPEANTANTANALKGPARAVVRYERKGHGGKDMTRIADLELSPAALDTWLKELKSSLGCGGVIAGKDLLLQGDQRPRLAALLEKRGVRRVVVA